MQRYGWDYSDRFYRGYESARRPGGGHRPQPSRYGPDYHLSRGQGGRWRVPASGRRVAYGYGGEAYQDWGRGYAWEYGAAPDPRGHGRGRPGRQRWAPDEDGGADSVRAADIMTRNPEAVTPDTPLADVARRMRDLDVGVMPVVSDEESYHLDGIVTDRDIAVRAAAEGKDMKKTAVREIMSADPHTVRESDHVRDVFTVMKRAKVRRVPVTAPDGRLLGIIAQADLAVTYAGLDLQRETEVEEVIERISEPARPRWGREEATPDSRSRLLGRFRPDVELDIPERVRSGWRMLRREARDLVGRGYDRGWR